MNIVLFSASPLRTPSCQVCGKWCNINAPQKPECHRSCTLSAMTKHLHDTVPDSTVASMTSVIGMDLDTEKVKMLKLVCQFTLYSPARPDYDIEVIAPIDMSSLQHGSEQAYTDLVNTVLNMATDCTGPKGELT